LVVLAILVLLMAFAVPRILGRQKQANINTARTQLGMFKGALDLYQFDMGTLPTTEEGLEALFQAPTVSEEGATSKWAGPYTNAPELPKDPWGNPYQYEYPPTRGSGPAPDIWSYGPDGQDNTEDDIVSWGSGTGEGAEDEFGTEPEFDDMDFDDGGLDQGGMEDFGEFEYSDTGLE
jgi:general secretion pathway protein G